MRQEAKKLLVISPQFIQKMKVKSCLCILRRCSQVMIPYRQYEWRKYVENLLIETSDFVGLV